MKCSIIQDLLPLYIDGCCSPESAQAVASHLENCQNCKALYDAMRKPTAAVSVSPAPQKLQRIQDWRASVMQSLLLFLSFGMITLGVAWEAGIPSGLMNGFWAFNLVIPATGFLLSLANWYFIRLYPSRKAFSTVSLLATLGITLMADFWALWHYEINLAYLLSGKGIHEALEISHAMILLNGTGILLTCIFCILSKVLSGRYAKMLGKL
jgi:hypothetical protein